MTPRQRHLVQSTWEYVLPLASIAVELFYARLFRLDPSLRPFIAEKLPAQKRILVPGLTILVHGLNDLDSFLPAIRQLGRRPDCDGIAYAAPDTLRDALLHTLGEILGPLYTLETESAWNAFYDLIAGAGTETDGGDERHAIQPTNPSPAHSASVPTTSCSTL